MEKLIQYFQSHYQSRQEVLFRLPLSYSIDAFWPELLKRRKAKATVLPLYNAAGMPYWYVLTDRMIAASERLCAEAMTRDDTFDPYRAEMTSAMTEEMFFTSFVEGAQIPLQEVMDFLARGTEPESIQEQMIWNNRRAWSELANGIYRPLDEEFIRRLAMTLTEGMDAILSGSLELKDGCVQFNDEGIQKIAEFYKEDVKELDSRIRELKDAAREYTSFSGAASDMNSTVKFIIKADTIA